MSTQPTTQTPTIRFAVDYTKLSKKEFTTIRKGNKGLQIGQTVKCLSPSFCFFAEIVKIETFPLKDLPIHLLQEDVTPFAVIKNRRDFFNSMLKYYPDLSYSANLVVFHLKKLE